MKPDHLLKQAKLSLLLLVVLAPVIIWIMGCLLPEPPASSILNDHFWANKIANEDKYDIVITGDSRVYRGIDPGILSRKMNLSAFNYGFSSAGLDSLLIDNVVQLLDPKGKKILMIGVTPASFTDESLNNEHWKSLKKLDSKVLWIQKNLYPSLSFFNAYSLSDLKKIQQNEKYYQTFNNNGFAFSNRIPADTFIALAPYVQFLNENKINYGALANFCQLIKQLNETGIKCYAFRVPVATPVKQIEDRLFDFGYFIHEFEQSGGVWIPMPQYGFSSYDGSHLEGLSAQKYSALLADSLMHHLPE